MNPRRHLNAWLVSAMLALVTLVPALAEPPPAPWIAQDISGPPTPGSTDVDASGVWTIQGSGADIFGDTDQFHFAYRPLAGDGSISARFLSREGGQGEWAKTGLMVRENDTPSSANLNFTMTPGHGLHTTFRRAQDIASGSFDEVGPARKPEANLFMRLQRVGQEVAGFYSRDGTLWTQADFPPVTLPTLKEEALFGFAVSSLTTGLTTAKFDQVSAQPGVVSAYGIQACAADRAILLQWRPLKNAVAYNIYRGPADATRAQLAKINTDTVAGSSFTDNSSDLVNGTPVLYAVGAVFQGADGKPVEGPLVGVLATPVAVPAGLMGCSINGGPSPGSAAFDPATGEITLRGSGDIIGIWSDQAYFLGQPVEGDVQITARVLSPPTGKGIFRLAGLMIRESLDADSRNMVIGIRPAQPFSGFLSGLVRQWRPAANSDTFVFQSIHSRTLKLPIVLRLTRRGDKITPEYSTDDGKTFQVAPTVSFAPPLAKTLQVGLAITAGTDSSADRTQVSEAKFANLEIKKL
jgi:regulation of enolase protein 1 (concanavalin A-like superfamily)